MDTIECDEFACELAYRDAQAKLCSDMLCCQPAVVGDTDGAGTWCLECFEVLED